MSAESDLISQKKINADFNKDLAFIMKNELINMLILNILLVYFDFHFMVFNIPSTPIHY